MTVSKRELHAVLDRGLDPTAALNQIRGLVYEGTTPAAFAANLVAPAPEPEPLDVSGDDPPTAGVGGTVSGGD